MNNAQDSQSGITNLLAALPARVRKRRDSVSEMSFVGGPNRHRTTGVIVSSLGMLLLLLLLVSFFRTARGNPAGCPPGSTTLGPGNCLCNDPLANFIGGACVCPVGYQWSPAHGFCICAPGYGVP